MPQQPKILFIMGQPPLSLCATLHDPYTRAGVVPLGAGTFCAERARETVTPGGMGLRQPGMQLKWNPWGGRQEVAEYEEEEELVAVVCE